ncbi:hypothetical protein GCM10011371_28100 [Novosphingobium marinum]|jgi:N-acetylglutamate synthase-like GNAT family acetyltransferase|uniref:N-acetylglutamate synthase-like GNAT family acetyltransferase n=1 Tax=Novosphingobium marinum TaxID=1514948 RepID=A0A7Z0BWV6_9SPHN|nr:hypothetical protein [Novosphingobium marinum]NYH96682.1 N-acetylglutamate synthase-like GNAT family acetyltransferase [Novosphingobium marinum]GGC39101.1 hypothetical protein GCM10011371_28100 [Novosphingobium marinum]
MDKTQHGLIAKVPQNDGLMAVLEQQPTLSNFVKQAGLQEVAEMVEGDSFVVCDLDLHGVQGCADMREMVANQQMVAECVALGLAILIAVIVGSIAVAFVNLATKFAAPLGMNRVYALFPRRLNEFWREKEA